MYDATGISDDEEAPVKVEVKKEMFTGENESEEEEDEPTPPAEIHQMESASGTMVNVNGVPKALEDITDDDQEEMTPDEYQVSSHLLRSENNMQLTIPGILRCCECRIVQCNLINLICQYRRKAV